MGGIGFCELLKQNCKQIWMWNVWLKNRTLSKFAVFGVYVQLYIEQLNLEYMLKFLKLRWIDWTTLIMWFGCNVNALFICILASQVQPCQIFYQSYCFLFFTFEIVSLQFDRKSCLLAFGLFCFWFKWSLNK